MEPINFINTVSAHAYRSLSRWYICSMGALFVVVVGMLSAQLWQCSELYQAYTRSNALQLESAPFNDVMIEYADLQQKITTTKSQAATLQELSALGTIFSGRLTDLAKAAIPNVLIESCVLAPMTATVTALMKNTREVTAYLQKIKQLSYCAHVSLSSLEPHGSQVRAVIEVTVCTQQT